MTIDSRDDFAQWAIERTKSILTDQGSDLASAARARDDARMGEAANALGDGLVDDDRD